MSSDVLHFRIEKDERRGKRGQIRMSRSDQIFVTFPGEDLERLIPGVKAYSIESTVDGVDGITLTVVASTEIEWIGEEPEF